MEITFSAEAETAESTDILLAWIVTARLSGIALWTGRYPVPGVVIGTACDWGRADFAQWLRDRLWTGLVPPGGDVPQLLIDKDLPVDW